MCRHPPVCGTKVTSVQTGALPVQLRDPHQLPGAAQHVCQADQAEAVGDQRPAQEDQDRSGQAPEHRPGGEQTAGRAGGDAATARAGPDRD